MADPLSIGVSVLAVLTATIKSTKALTETVKRYKERDKTLNRLHHELEDLIKVLGSLEEAIETDSSAAAILKDPVDRCGQICHEFNEAMDKFGAKSKTGWRDWARMEFAREDINSFIDNIANYKGTIMVALGTITIRHSKITQQVLEGYSELIKDTSYSLEVRLRRIEALIVTDGSATHNTSVDLEDEREATLQCIRICEDAKSYLDSLQNQQPSLRQPAPVTLSDTVHSQFEAVLKTSQVLNQNQENLAQTIRDLQQRLSSFLSSEGPQRSSQEERLRADIDMSRQCLEVCKIASEQLRYQKIHTIGEVHAEDDTDQMVVTTVADLFDVKKVLAKSRTSQIVGSMSDATLQKVSDGRYRSRYGGMDVNPEHPTPTPSETRSGNAQPATTKSESKQPQTPDTARKPSSNEMRKRATEGESETPKFGRQ
jgi:hypothetical protein